MLLRWLIILAMLSCPYLCTLSGATAFGTKWKLPCCPCCAKQGCAPGATDDAPPAPRRPAPSSCLCAGAVLEKAPAVVGQSARPCPPPCDAIAAQTWRASPSPHGELVWNYLSQAPAGPMPRTFLVSLRC